MHMSKMYRVDVRYVANDDGVGALERVCLLKEQFGDRGYVVTDAAIFDDGMRISLNVGSVSGRIPQLALLGIVSKTGSIGRFSCRDLDALEQSERLTAGSPEEALA